MNRTFKSAKLVSFLMSLWLLCSCSTKPPPFVAATASELPLEVALNRQAGRGGYLIVNLRLESGEELPFIVDTGAAATLLSNSLDSKLGDRLGTVKLRTLYGNYDSGVYKAPNLYLGNTRLITGSNVITCNLTLLSLRAHRSIKGILGMDCLRNYCVQLDFEAAKMRFLDSSNLESKNLGELFPMTMSKQDFRPLIHQSALLAGKSEDTMIDTGCHLDGFIEKSATQGKNLGWWFWLFSCGNVKECVWDNKTYTDISIRARGNLNLLGLRFLGRHLVTLDFPNHIMYLKQISVGPLKNKE